MRSPPERVAPWRRRDFRIAWCAGFVNNTGDWVLLVALPVYVFIETESGAATAILFVAQLVAGAIIGPIGGALVDRWDLKRSLIGTNVAQAITVLPLLAVTQDRIWPAYLVMAAQSALNQINNPANVTLLPRVVDTDELSTANAAISAAESSARLIGAPLGGILVAWGGLTPIVLLDALSFGLVAIALRFLNADTSPRAATIGERKTVRGGIQILRDRPPLVALISIHGFAQVAQGGFVVLFVVFVIETLGDDGSGVGAIRGAMAIGALIGSGIIARFSSNTHSTTLFGAGLVGMGAISLLFWNMPTLTTTLWIYAFLFSLSGLPGAAVSVGLFTTLQTTSPPHALGRVTGVMAAGEAVGVATGSIITGLLIDHMSLRTLLNAQAVTYLAAGTIALILIRSPSASETPATPSPRSPGPRKRGP